MLFCVLYFAFVFLLDAKLAFSKPGDISNEKCEEYGKLVYVEEESPTMLRNVAPRKVSKCTVVSTPLIVGGKKAGNHEFPHMTQIGFGFNRNGELNWACGGALISENFILTAGHCLNNREAGSAQKVRLGSIDYTKEKWGAQEIFVKERIPHPEYHQSTKYNDIALILLEHPVEFSAYVRPACLNTVAQVQEQKATASGFGKLEYDGIQGSDTLMKVVLPLLPLSVCKEKYANEKIKLPQGIIDTMLCSGELTGGKDTCQGDSGGPLQIMLEKPYCMYNIIGVTSFGKYCGFANSPSVYTRVYSYVDWIEKVVWSSL